MKKFLFALLFFPILCFGQGSMDFESADLPETYEDGSFTENGIEYTFGHSRDQDTFPIDGQGLMLRRPSDSYLEWTVDNGMGELSFQYRKAFSGGAIRQLEIIVNDEQVAVSPEFGEGSGEQDDVYTLTADIDQEGSLTIRIKNVGDISQNRQAVIDNIEWTAYEDSNGVGDSTDSNIQLGTGQTSGSYFPIYYLYDYSYTQTIYLADELTAKGGVAGTINKIAYLPTSNANTEKWQNWSVYMSHTTKSGFDDDQDWMPVSGEMSQVFDGAIADTVIAGQWLEIELETSFEWDGTSNIVVAVVDNTNGWGGSPGFAHYTLEPESGSKGVRIYRDSDPFEVDNPPLDLFANSTSNSVARIQFSGDILETCENVSAGEIEAPEFACFGDDFELIAEGASGFQIGLSGLWQSSADGENWSDMEEANPALTTSITEETYFRYSVSCEGGNEDVSEAVLVEINPNVDECRCDPSGSSSSYYITSFTTSDGVDNIDNTVDEPNPDGYVAFTDMVVAQETGEEISFEVSVDSGTAGFAIWVDWYQNGEFILAYNSDSYSLNHSGTFIVPNDATLGLTVMRIGMSNVPATGPADACQVNSNNSFQDYGLEVVSSNCIKPFDLEINDLNTDSMSFSWTPGDTETAWEIAYGEGLNSDDITETTAITGDAEASIEGLMPGTSYKVYVRAVCADDDDTYSNWSTALTFSTPCTSTDIPFLQDFEEVNAPDLPLCGSIENNVGNDWETIDGDSTEYAATSRPDEFSGNSLLYRYTSFGTGTSDSWYFTQGLNLEAGVNYKLSYKYGNNSASYTEKIAVAIGNAPASSSMDTDDLLAQHEFGDNAAHDHEVEFTVEDDGVYYIGFQSYSEANQYYIYVDDIAVDFADETPIEDCEAPDNVEVNDITTNSAMVTWDEGNAAEWEVIYGEEGFDIDSEGTSEIVSEASFELNGLDAETGYDVYVRTICEDNESDWSEMVNFTTEEEVAGEGCEWTVRVWEDYYGDEVEWELRDADDNVLLSGGPYDILYEDEQSVTADGPLTFWITNDGSIGDNTPFYEISNDNGIVLFGQLAIEQGDFTYSDLECSSEALEECSGTPEAGTLTINPEEGPSGSEITFNYTGYSEPSIGLFYTIQYRFDEGPWDEFAPSVNTPDGEVLTVTGNVGSILEIKIEVTCENSGESATTDVVEFTITDGSVPEECEDPSDITTETNEDNTDVVVSWTANGNESQWEVVYGLTGFDIETEGTSEIISAPTYTIQGLEEETDYDVYVRAICDEENSSDWVGPVTFTTITLGMEDFAFENFTFYPNPVQDQLNLKANQEIESIVIYNLTGQKIIEIQPNTVQTSVSTAQLQSGVYLMDVQVNGATKNFRIIKK